MNFSKALIFLFFTVLSPYTFAQFHPAAGQPGTSAMHKDSSAFIDWVTACEVTRGLQNCSDTTAGYASAGDSTQVFGVAGSNGIVSLGDGGSAICSFSVPVVNGTGYDFAVFENSFHPNFLELAVVEVSSDGFNYYRFPPTSFVQDTLQIGPFDTAGVPEKINNLAGKYIALYGTPFDLEEMTGVSGLDVNNITHIKIIDVVGSLDKNCATYDQYGNAINDPWPTEFPTGGFDLEAIGVINNQWNSVNETEEDFHVGFYPNPVKEFIRLIAPNKHKFKLKLFDVNGIIVWQTETTSGQHIQMDFLNPGIYLLEIQEGNFRSNKLLVKQ